MKISTETYFIANDGKKFTNENKCKEYEAALIKIDTLTAQIQELTKELAFTEYFAYHKDAYIPETQYASGNGHDGFYHKCPECEAFVGGYANLNTALKVDNGIYKCEQCGSFFRYN